MGKIIVLDENTACKIAAGEVIERPASVVKELLENSIDAGATSISVEIKNGGISYIKIADNGSGIGADDAEKAFERHSTSKIRSSDDLNSITTFGFRGEALASIAAVSEVRMVTKTAGDNHGICIELKGGKIIDVRQAGCPVGTTVTVKNLFFNTPARYKFLKKDNTEAGYIFDIVSRTALSGKHISFSLTNNGSIVVHTPGNNDLLSAIYSIYGRETAGSMKKIDYNGNGVSITGYAGKPELARSNRNCQSIYVNGRYIKNKVISSAIDEAYKTFLMKNKYAFIILFVDISPSLVDVNVHPAKMEVRFANEQDIYRHVYHAVNNALLGNIEKMSAAIFDKGIAESAGMSNESIRPEDSSACENKTCHEFRQQEMMLNSCFGRYFRQDENFREEAPVLCQCVKENGNVYEKEYCKESDSERLDIFSNAKIIGQAFMTYIILQDGEKLLLIDQHAAHERIMYEKLKRKYSQKAAMSQELLAPVVIELAYRELGFVKEEKEFFHKIGFIYEEFGNNSIVLRSVPLDFDGASAKEMFLEVMDRAMNSEKKDFEALADETLYAVACKAAVKANSKLGNMEMDGILRELETLENPYTCPHGRPTAIVFTRQDLDKMFKRNNPGG